MDYPDHRVPKKQGTTCRPKGSDQAKDSSIVVYTPRRCHVQNGILGSTIAVPPQGQSATRHEKSPGGNMREPYGRTVTDEKNPQAGLFLAEYKSIFTEVDTKVQDYFWPNIKEYSYKWTERCNKCQCSQTAPGPNVLDHCCTIICQMGD